MFKVSITTVVTWELNLKEPTKKYAKPIISFLGYFPLWKDNLSLGTQLYYARLITGKTQKQVSKIIGCDTTNLIRIEKNNRRPFPLLKLKIKNFIEQTKSKVSFHPIQN